MKKENGIIKYSQEEVFGTMDLIGNTQGLIICSHFRSIMNIINKTKSLGWKWSHKTIFKHIFFENIHYSSIMRPDDQAPYKMNQ